MLAKLMYGSTHASDFHAQLLAFLFRRSLQCINLVASSAQEGSEDGGTCILYQHGPFQKAGLQHKSSCITIQKLPIIYYLCNTPCTSLRNTLKPYNRASRDPAMQTFVCPSRRPKEL